MSAWPRRIGVALGVATPLFAAFTMIVHVPGVVSGCPFGHDRATPRSAVAQLDAAVAPALGFQLGATTRADVEQWAARHGVTCTARRTQLECRDVPAAALAPASDLPAGSIWFELDARDAVASVRTARRSTALERVTRALDHALPVSDVVATGDVQALPRGAFQQVTRELSRRGYRAVVRATNMGDGYLLTESYRAL